eukprot:SAG11_NODE_4596_length_1840_cov_1.198162_4_plen_85_part_00
MPRASAAMEYFDAISYSKVRAARAPPRARRCPRADRRLAQRLSQGASVLRMLLEYVGEATFRRGVARYLATHLYVRRGWLSLSP